MNHNHIIDRQAFEITLPERSNAFDTQGRFDNSLLADISNVIDAVFSRLCPSKEHVRFDRLELDLGTFRWDEMFIALPARLEQALLKKFPVMLHETGPVEILSIANTPSESAKLSVNAYESQDGDTIRIIAPRERDIETLIYFLQTGNLPWWHKALPLVKDYDALLATVSVADYAHRYQIQTLVTENKDVQIRLASQFSDRALAALVETLGGFDKQSLQKLLDELQADHSIEVLALNRQEIRLYFWQTVLGSLDGISMKPFLKDLPDKLFTKISEHEPDFLHRISVAPEMGRRPGPQGGPANIDKWLQDFILKRSALKRKAKASQNVQLSPDKPRLDESPETAKTYGPGKKPETRKQCSVVTAPKTWAPADSVIFQQSRQTEQEVRFTVRNCGLALFWPFLGVLFSELGFVRDGAFLDKKKRFRAITVLQYLITGKDSAPEPDLVLNKILCGLSPASPVAAQSPLAPKEKKEAGKLLKAVVEHWSALKKTSVKGLQSAFLQRSGLLEENEEGYLLRVEGKGYDVLLERMPWSISIIKMSWMKRPLHVEWSPI